MGGAVMPRRSSHSYAAGVCLVLLAAAGNSGAAGFALGVVIGATKDALGLIGATLGPGATIGVIGGALVFAIAALGGVGIGGALIAGAITAGLFLQEFVDGAAWAHLDIAGPAFADKEWATLFRSSNQSITRLGHKPIANAGEGVGV